MSIWDDTGYDLDDPKHPTWRERYADWGDDLRKREKEQGPEPEQDDALQDQGGNA